MHTVSHCTLPPSLFLIHPFRCICTPFQLIGTLIKKVFIYVLIAVTYAMLINFQTIAFVRLVCRAFRIRYDADDDDAAGRP